MYPNICWDIEPGAWREKFSEIQISPQVIRQSFFLFRVVVTSNKKNFQRQNGGANTPMSALQRRGQN